MHSVPATLLARPHVPATFWTPGSPGAFSVPVLALHGVGALARCLRTFASLGCNCRALWRHVSSRRSLGGFGMRRLALARRVGATLALAIRSLGLGWLGFHRRRLDRAWSLLGKGLRRRVVDGLHSEEARGRQQEARVRRVVALAWLAAEEQQQLPGEAVILSMGFEDGRQVCCGLPPGSTRLHFSVQAEGVRPRQRVFGRADGRVTQARRVGT
mmetsp:Transcript_121619/g.171167  ORF Transcript_121619/g.171167 Transcript_121619/m.171167 type:complete len:214 (+) Transcript_121619:167-808(+)